MKSIQLNFQNRNALITFGCFTLIFITYITGFWNDLIDFDAPQYANMSKDMFFTKSYLQVYDRGNDYLDKPPLLFWTSVLSYHIFGINDFAYRLPSFLVSILGLYSLYRFTLLYYSKKVAVYAALIAASSQAYFLMHHDVRTDTLLTGFIMFTMWQIATFNQTGKLKHIVLGAIGIGFAMLSKGPIGLMLPVIAFGSDFIYKRNWKAFFKWQYLLVLVIVALILAPMTYGLYMQFDMHPEIDSYYTISPSGVRFFYWTQSFGRIFGDNPVPSNFPDPFFLYHSLLWSLLPWPLIFIVAMVYDVKTKIKSFKTNYLNVEVMSTAGFIITIVMLSMSTYQLPHYTFIIHPFAALIISNFLVNVLGSLKWKNVFIYLSVLVWVICVSLSYYIMFVSFETSVLIIIITNILFITGIVCLFKLKSELETRIIVCGIFIVCASNYMVNTAFYKPCFKFQSDSEIAKAMNAMNVKQFSVYHTEITNSGYFYFHGKIDELYSYKEINLDSANTSGWIMTDSIGKLQIDSVYTIKESKLFYDFPVSAITVEFLNPKTRLAQCKKNYIIKLEKK